MFAERSLRCITTTVILLVFVTIKGQKAEAPMPTIYSGEQFFMDGDDFSINCTVPRRDIAVELSWKVPGPRTKVRNVSNAYEINGKDNLYNNITVINASSEDKGKYTCITQTSYGTKNSTIEKKYLENAFLEVRKANNDKVLIHTMSRVVQLKIEIKSYPPANVTTIYKDDPKRVIVPDGKKYVVMIVKRNFYLKITELTPSDTGKYTFIVSNGHLTKNVSYDFRYPGPPKVQFGQPDMPLKYIKNVVASLKCEAIGYPVPQIKWEFEHDGTTSEIKNHQTDKKIFMYQQISILQFNVTKSGRITCRAINENGTDFVTRRFLVYEIENGFGVENLDKLWFPEGRTVEIKCLASLYDFNNVSWSAEDGKEFYVQDADTTDSIVSLLRIENIGVEQAGDYTCSGLRNNGSVETQTITVTVAKTHAPLVISPKDETHEVVPFQPVSISCTADAVPPPVIEWTKDDILLANTSDIEIKTVRQNLTMINSTIYINKMKEELTGSYQCLVISGTTPAYKHYNIFMTDKSPHKTMYLSVAGVIFFVLILLVAYLTWKIRKEKQFRKELAAAGLLYFKEGVTKSLNPDLGIDEQAELLPYDDKFEFPIEKLTLGKQLGAGAFGVVYKAEARGIINAEQSTTVAVKMVKKTADNMYIKALASELKIMVHLGRHINIVNLLGACTKNVGKRELAVIVEYCKFGNIHNYLQKHREVFINQLTDNFDKNLGKVNRGYSCSSANSGMHSDYFGSNHTQETDHTFVNTANTNRSGVKVSQSGYLMQPEWRSNYESDYSFDGRSPRPLCSRDLLAWSFQIARGMEYLASRKIVHGDLAARNILLAEDNVVKICDFGLARSIYKNDEYQKKENSLLPVKWLAIECMTDRIFSTQSDVWSFGIVLWELFTLAKTPYPNISPPSLLQFLSEGHRLEKPPYADDKLYDVMRRCWAQKPTARPGFSQLQEIMGSFLEDNVRNHYVDLNATNVKSNMKQAGEEDYLAMVCAPDYNNLVTPSPHHYVNDARRFFPSTPNQIQQDDEGYLEMSPASRQSIFHARTQGTKFDFEARNLNPRVSEANSYGSESTPMLTLNNLPRSGSESDQEGNPSPYLNMHPKIEEETDDVFNTNEINSKNVNPSAVTNPTYITLNDEKKQQNFANNYINVPNGLVK